MPRCGAAWGQMNPADCYYCSSREFAGSGQRASWPGFGSERVQGTRPRSDPNFGPAEAGRALLIQLQA